MNKRNTKLAIGSIGLGLVAAGLTGCGNSVYALRLDPSPAASSLSRNRAMVHNDLIVVMDTDLRNVQDDMERLWLLDQPSKLHPRLKPRSP